MKDTTSPKPYHIQAELSEVAKTALIKEQGKRQQNGKKVRLKDIATEVLENWALSVA